MAETITELIKQGQDVTTTLSEEEKHTLEQHEAVIGRGLNTFLEVGSALAEIRDRRLYRETHKTFEKYCKDIWDLSKGYANQQIGGYQTVVLLESKMAAIAAKNEPERAASINPDNPQGIILPITESQTRPLTKLKNPDDKVKAWSLVLDELNQNPKAKLTAARITKAVKKVQGIAVQKQIKKTKKAVKETSLLSNQFKNQHQVLLDIIVAAKNEGWINDKRGEVIKHLEALVKIAKSDD